MSEGHSHGYSPVYPAYCHIAAPTYWKWVKLTAADVHALRSESGYAGQDVYFHLNHPIQYVYLCGTVVAIDYFPRFTVLVLDDGSGQTIELKIELVTPSKSSQHTVKNGSDVEEADGEAEHRHVAGGAFNGALIAPEPSTISTLVENVMITKACHDSRCFAKHVTIDGKMIEVGTIIKARGTLARFRGMFQLRLRRTNVIEDTEEELRVWKDYAGFCQKVLVHPWRLTDEEVRVLEQSDRQRMHETQQAKERQTQARQAAEQKRAERRERWLARVQREEERLERRRVREEHELNGNALDLLPRRAAEIGDGKAPR